MKQAVTPSDSDAIRDLLRHEQERSFEIDRIGEALIEGEQSGEPQQFDFATFKQRKIAQFSRDAPDPRHDHHSISATHISPPK